MKVGSGVLKSSGGAGPGTKETGAPKHLVVSTRNGKDPARAGAPNSGQTKTSPGGRGKGGKD